MLDKDVIISECTRAKGQLKSCNILLTEFIDKLHDPVVALDDEQKVVAINRAYRQQVKLPTKKIVGQPYWDIFPKKKDCLREKEFQIDDKDYYRVCSVDVPTKQNRTYSVHILENINDRVAIEKELEHRVASDRLVSEIALTFAMLQFSHLDEGIQYAVERIGKFAQVDRSYLWVFSEGVRKIEYVYEWHIAKSQAQKEKVLNYDLRDLPWFRRVIAKIDTIYVPDIKKLPDEARSERKLWSSLNIKSLLQIPLFIESKPFGIIGFDQISKAKDWDAEDVALLRVIGQLLSEAWSHKLFTKSKKRAANDLEDSLAQSIQAIAAAIEHTDPYTFTHQQRVGKLASALAAELGYAPAQVKGIELAALIHDVGHIKLPSEIMSRPGPISNKEFELIKRHPNIGYEIIKNIKSPWPLAEVVLQHHERINGSGYPLGLAGEDICHEAKIVAVADVVSAMTSHRPFRPAMTMDDALVELQNNSGVLYDVAVVNACGKIVRENGFGFDV
ncbi:MAG: HD domain-containing protein [Gammaproteobacteria bacterium]|nr:HD domain-containing protein [Gammaproteobacteria bacterium]